jgi:hypothetical protein
MAELAALASSIAITVAEAAPAAATVAEALPAIGTALSVGGTVVGGIAAKNEGEFAAKQAKRQATEERAIASREAEDQRLKTALVLSKQKAGAAASGAGVLNPTILDIMGDTAQAGDYAARSIVAGGANRSAGLMDQAAAAKYRGNSAFAGAMLEGLGEAATGTYKMKKSRYG